VPLAARTTGLLVARVLAGSWRSPAPPIPEELTVDDLSRVWPLLAASGSIGLLWRRLQSSARPELGDVAAQVEPCYFQQLLDSRRHEQALEKIFVELHAAGIRPLLIKGWSVARHHSAAGLRPYTDIDLVVRPEERSRAGAVLERLGPLPLSVDLHGRVPHAGGRDPGELERRVERARLGGVDVDVLGAEDQLRLLCLHLLIHGAERTIWLVDLALLVEKQRASLDWDYLLAGDARDADAVLCALALAGRLLDVPLDGTPAAGRASRLPPWLVDCVVDAWGRGYQPHGQLGGIPRGARALLQAARERWPNPIAATASLRAPYDDFPRLPLQLADYVKRAASLLRRITVD
jgi:hypothetical protein